MVPDGVFEWDIPESGIRMKHPKISTDPNLLTSPVILSIALAQRTMLRCAFLFALYASTIYAFSVRPNSVRVVLQVRRAVAKHDAESGGPAAAGEGIGIIRRRAFLNKARYMSVLIPRKQFIPIFMFSRGL